MSKVFDEASELENTLRESGVAAVRQLVQPQQHPDFDGLHCIDCDADIPQKRLELGRIRCVECQTLIEKRGG